MSDITYVVPGSGQTAYLVDAGTGLLGSLQVTIYDEHGAVLLAPTSSGIRDLGDGTYARDFTAPTDGDTDFFVEWISGTDTGTEQWHTSSGVPSPPGPLGDGVPRLPGIEAQHTWQPASGPAFSLGGVDVVTRATWPRYVLGQILGRHSKPDQQDNRDLATARIGEIARRSLLRGKTEAWNGLIAAQSLPQLRDATDALVAAFAENEEGVMTVHSPASYAGPDFTFTARVLSCDVADSQDYGPAPGMGQQTTGFVLGSGGWMRTFTLGLRLSDPRYYESTEQTGQTSAFIPAGGLVAPFTAPVVVSGPAVPAGSVSLVNGGKAPADPVFELHGPVSDPWLVNDTLDAALVFEAGSLLVQAGQVLVVDFGKRTLMLNGQPVSRQMVDWGRSNWWDAGVPGLGVGDNLVRYGGSAASDPAFAFARWHNPRYG